MMAKKKTFEVLMVGLHPKYAAFVSDQHMYMYMYETCMSL